MVHWLQAGAAPRPTYPGPRQIVDIFAHVKTAARRAKPFIPLENSPLREDVEAQMVANGELPSAAATLMLAPRP